MAPPETPMNPSNGLWCLLSKQSIIPAVNAVLNPPPCAIITRFILCAHKIIGLFKLTIYSKDLSHSHLIKYKKSLWKSRVWARINKSLNSVYFTTNDGPEATDQRVIGFLISSISDPSLELELSSILDEPWLSLIDSKNVDAIVHWAYI